MAAMEITSDTLVYPMDLDVHYTTDAEYRACLRRLVQMRPVCPQEDVDPVSQDEWNFDEAAMSAFLDHLYQATGTHSLFQELYEKAAGTMLSEDQEMGLAVLCSYSYLARFHRCLVLFFRQKSDASNADELTHALEAFVAFFKK